MRQITHCVIIYEWLKRLNTQPNKSTNQNSLKSPKLLSKQIRKRYHKTLETFIYLSMFWKKLKNWRN